MLCLHINVLFTCILWKVVFTTHASINDDSQYCLECILYYCEFPYHCEYYIICQAYDVYVNNDFSHSLSSGPNIAFIISLM